jgi:RNA polymerase sigma-70 factor (ECF subfamily)
MEKLPDQCREIFILCRYHLLSYPEIASQLDVSLSTVKTQMVRAMMKLKEGLKEFL